MIATVIIVQNTQICTQLCKVSNLELAILQLKYHGSIQVAIKEQQVYPVVVAQFIKVYLTARESETTPEGHDEVLHVVDDIALNHAFVDVLVVHAQLLYVDKVKQILILKHADGAISLFVVGDGCQKIVGHLVLMVVEILLDFINVEELGMHDEDINENVIESNIVHNVKNFIMTFGRGFSFSGSQVHFDKLGHDHWIDLLFFNRDLNRTVVFELKNGKFKVGYLAQLSAYLRILNDDDRRDHEEAPIGIILCKEADKDYAGYIMQDFRQPMGVATYKTADEMDPELLKALPPKEELQRVFVESSKKSANE